MYYVDTSVLAAYYCPEELSEKAETFLRIHLQPAISPLTEVELFSAISRKIREGTLSRDDGSRITHVFLSHRDAAFYRRIEMEDCHYQMARDWISQFNTPLRSLDAIHLAVASSGALTLVTADESLAKSAEILGINAVLISVDL